MIDFKYRYPDEIRIDINIPSQESIKSLKSLKNKTERNKKEKIITKNTSIDNELLIIRKE